MQQRDPVVGVDVGGTKIVVGYFRGAEPVMRLQYPTWEGKGSTAPEVLLPRLAGYVQDVVWRVGERPMAIGLGLPGPVDALRGVAHRLPNVPGWEQPQEVCAPLSRNLGIPAVFGDNDANVAAVAEHEFGAGQESQFLVYITFSTGVGAGGYVAGKVLRGANGVGMEAGHIGVLRDGPACGCGSTGCWEQMAAGPSVNCRVRELLARDGGEDLRHFAVGKSVAAEELQAELVAEAARLGIVSAQQIMADLAYWIGFGLAGIVNVLNPDLIVIGGGLAKAWDVAVEPGIAVMRERSMPIARDVPIVPARFGDDAVLVGAAALAYEELRQAA